MKEPQNRETPEQIKLLKEIRNLLKSQQPRFKPWWQKRILWMFAAGLILLCFIQFPSEANRKADMVITSGSELKLFILPEPNWEKLGLHAIPNFRKVPGEMSLGMYVNTLLQLNLTRQGRSYMQSGIRVSRLETELKIDLHSNPIINGPTKIVIEPIGKNDVTELKMINSIIRNYGIEADGRRLPLYQFIDTKTMKGHVVVETRSPIGYQRFLSNLERAFNLAY